MYRLIVFLPLLLLLFCQKTDKSMRFGDDLAFIDAHTDVLILKDNREKGMLVVAPAWQGRVMTSTSGGMDGLSYGWINRGLIKSGEVQEHINAFGGEDRFWLGPEGGQFSLYFDAGDAFDLENWQVPPSLDTEPFAVYSHDTGSAALGRDMTLTNYSGTTFDLNVERTLTILQAEEYLSERGIDLPSGLSAVAYESVNDVTNTGEQKWEKESGCLSIWILGMFNATSRTTVMIPYRQGNADSLGPVVNDRYFGEIGADRLVMKDGLIYFKADGAKRSKIGLSPQRSTSVLGSYDAERGILTVIYYNKPEGRTDYVNSLWEWQEEPYSGDVVNSYNDGPAQPGGSQLGKFYELETSSPALMLAPGETYRHIHTTLHMEGSAELLAAICRSIFGIDLKQVAGIF